MQIKITNISKTLMKKITLILLSLMTLSACLQEPEALLDQVSGISSDFNFQTTQTIQVDIRLSDALGEAMNGIKFSLYESTEDGVGKKLFTAVTDASGRLKQEMNLPSYYEQVIFKTDFIGIPSDVFLPILNQQVAFIYDRGQIVSSYIEVDSYANASIGFAAAGTSNSTKIKFDYLGKYSKDGVPDYLEPERDKISREILANIAASLPEGQPVPKYHPTYLANGKKTTLEVTELADVWVTFVHEGAGWTNALGYYTYETSSPPQSLDDIETVQVIFPNMSFKGSGGGLVSGDKVKLGRFEAGISIGLVLLADGWDGKKSENFKYLLFTDKQLNPESSDDLKQHNVLLWDEENELFLIGFEDTRRDNSEPFESDEDFNDAVLFVTSNPVRAISSKGVNPVDKPGTLDRDEDGINDIFDEFPDDPNKAYVSYYPAVESYGSFAFEDNWPDFGDYDFNDMVVDYQFMHTLNASNKIVEMNSKFVFKAVGAGYRNGFGFSTNLSTSDILSSEGSILKGSSVQVNANGTEAKQEQAVFIVTDNVSQLFSGSGFVNTEQGGLFQEPVTLELNTIFNGGKSYEDIGIAPYNPFLIISQERGREVHMPDQLPTSLVNIEYFGTMDDASIPLENIYFRSKTALPWVIHLPESFDYPIEKTDIRSAYLNFQKWAESYGSKNMDWYKDLPGNRKTSGIFQK